MHFRWSFIFSTYGLYSLPGSNFAPFEEVKVPVSNSDEFFQKKCPFENFGGFGVVRVKDLDFEAKYRDFINNDTFK